MTSNIRSLAIAAAIVLARPLLGQSTMIHLRARETDRQMYISNAVFQTNSSGKYEQAAMARILLESYRANPSLPPADAIAQMNHLRDQYLQSGVGAQQSLSQKDTIDSMLNLAGGLLPGPYGKGVEVAKTVFDHVADKQLDELTTEATVIDTLSRSQTYADVQETQESTWAGLYDDASRNPYLAQVVKSVFSTSLKANVGDTANEIMQENPAFATNRDVAEIRSHIVNGELQIDKSELTKAASDEEGIALSALDNQRKTLNGLQHDQGELLAYVRDQAARQTAQAKIDQQWQMDQLKLGAAQSGITLLSGIARVAGDSQLAGVISTTGGATIQVATAINQYSRTIATLGSSASGLGAAVLTGNIASAVFQVMSLFGFGGPSTDQLILQQLGQLRQEVQQLHQDMTFRFDEIDKRLNSLSDQVDLRFNLVDLQLGRINGDTQQTLSELTSIEAQIGALQVLTTAVARQQDRANLAHQIDLGLFTQERHRARPSRQTLEAFESFFYTYAVQDSANDIHEPVTGRATGDVQVGDALAPLSPYENIAYTLQYLHSAFPEQTSYWTLSNIANPYDWAEGAASYVELCKEMVSYRLRCDTRRRGGVESVGHSTRTAMTQLISKPDGTSNTALLDALINNYKTKLQELSGSISESIKEKQRSIYPIASVSDYNADLDLWAGASQPSKFIPNFSSIDRCPGIGPSFTAPAFNPLPENLGALVPPIYRLAQQLGMGTVEICLQDWNTIESSSIDQIPTPFGGRFPVVMVVPSLNLVFGFHATEARMIDVYHVAGISKARQLEINASNSQGWTNWMNANWTAGDNMRSRFSSSGYFLDVKTLGTPVSKRQPTAASILDQHAKYRIELAGQVDARLRDEQRAVYQELVTQLSSGNLKSRSEALYGAKQLLIEYSALALPTSINDDDLLRSMLYGTNSILGGDDVAISFELSLAHAGADKNIDRVDTENIGKTRIDALAERLLSLITATNNKKITQHYELLDQAIGMFH